MACHSEQKGCQAGMVSKEVALISPNRSWRDINGGAHLSLSSVAISMSCPDNLSTTLRSSNTFYLLYSIPNTHIFMPSLSPRDRNLILISLYISGSYCALSPNPDVSTWRIMSPRKSSSKIRPGTFPENLALLASQVLKALCPFYHISGSWANTIS